MHPPLVVDPVTAERIRASEPPEGWRQRRLYVGSEAAKRWLRVAAEQDFRRPVGRMEQALFGAGRARAKELAAAVLRVAGERDEWSTLVSLGPGDARLDLDLVRALGTGYVAVDLSEKLLTRALETLASETDRRLGILADFEERFGFVAAELEERTTGPRLLALLGNTFGNLDRGERAFLECLTGSLDADDAFLLSLSTQGPGWKAESEPLLGAAGYSARVQRFLGARNSVEFEDGVHFRAGHSDVPGASAVEVVDRESGEPRIVVRRYDLDALRGWLTGALGLEVVRSENVRFDDVEGAAVVLLRTRARARVSSRGS